MIFAQPLRVTTLVIPIGVAVGKTLSTSEQVTITPFAIPQYLHVRTTLKDAESEADYGTETEHEWGAVLGISVGGRRLFGTLGAELTSAGDWEPALSLGVGLILR